MPEQDWLLEQCKTIRNLADICVILREAGMNELLPTAMELILDQAQQLVDDHCVVRDG